MNDISPELNHSLPNKDNRSVKSRLKKVAGKVVLGTPLAGLILSSGTVDNPNFPVPKIKEPTPASAAQRQEANRFTLERGELPEGSCVLEEKGDGVYELKSGTKSPKENSFNRSFSDVLQNLGYSNDDPRVVFIHSSNGIGKGYAITPDLVLTVDHVAGAKRSIYNEKLSSVRINHYGKELAVDDKYARGDAVVLRDAWSKSLEGTSSVQENRNYAERLTYLILGTGNEVNDPFTTGIPIATIPGKDIALIKLNSPLPNIEGTVIFKDNYTEGTKVTIRRSPSKRLFLNGVAKSGRFETANLQTYDKAEADRFLEGLPGEGTSGSVVIDADGNIIAVMSMGFTNRGTSKLDNGTLYTIHGEFSSGATPSEIIGMVKEYCDSIQNR